MQPLVSTKSHCCLLPRLTQQISYHFPTFILFLPIYSAEQLEKLVSCLNEVIIPLLQILQWLLIASQKNKQCSSLWSTELWMAGTRLSLKSPWVHLSPLCYSSHAMLASAPRTLQASSHIATLKMWYFLPGIPSSSPLSVYPWDLRSNDTASGEVVLNTQSPQPHYLSSFYCYFPT